MGVTQTQETEENLRVALLNNPFVPPEGDVCYINDLPPELLSRIFEVGSADHGTEDEEDVEAGFWQSLNAHLDIKDTDENDAYDSDIIMREESGMGDSDEEGDESESDENDSDATGSSDSSSPWPPFPILVSHVCRHWRNVALSTPSLWTTIVVTPEAHASYELVSMLLERSKGLPIDISVDCEPHEHDCDVEAQPSDADLGILFSMLIPHIHRWRTMEVSVSEYRHMYVFLNAVSDPSVPAAHQLTALELYHHDDTDGFDNFVHPDMSKQFTLFAGSAPSLTRLVLWGVPVDWNQQWISSACNLIELELAYHPEDVRPSWAQFAAILRGASSLQKLALRMSGPSGHPPEWMIEPTPGSAADLNAPVQLPRVTEFTLAFHPQAHAIGLLHRFYLPVLKELVLDFDEGDYTSFVHELARPATSLVPAREQPRSLLNKLDKLKIAGLPCRLECVYKLYGELQNLTSLNISLSYLPPLFLDILWKPGTTTGRNDIWLPQLATLYVSGTSGDAIREVIRKRKEAGVPLTSLYVEESCDVDDEDVEWLKENVETFEFFDGSDDEDDTVDFGDLSEEIDEWADD